MKTYKENKNLNVYLGYIVWFFPPQIILPLFQVRLAYQGVPDACPGTGEKMYFPMNS